MRIFCLVLVCGIALGCGDAQQARRLEAARRNLQINRAQPAIDLLVSDTSAEAHYLKGTALYRLGHVDAAQEQASAALSLKPNIAKYQGFDLLLKLAKKDRSAIEPLISLHEQNRSSGAISLFVTSAFTAKGDVKRALAAFDSSLALTADAPEFMFEMLKHAVNAGRAAPAGMLVQRLANVAPDDAELMRALLLWSVKGNLAEPAQQILSRLEALSPSDPELAKQRIHVLALVNKKDEAVKAAESMYEEGSRTEESAMVYAYSLSEAPPTPEHEQALHQLVAKYPRNLEILAKYAIYLAKAKRLPAALEVLNTSIHSQTVKIHREHLIHAAIALCLGAGEATLAENEIKKYQEELNDPLLTAYFEGRVLYLRKEYDEALRKFRFVIERQKDATGTQRALAADTLTWMQKILSDQQIQKRLTGVVQHLKTNGEQESPPEGSTDKQPAQTAPEPGSPAQAP